ncbi:MAG: TIGR02452 family protein [Oscillospiraceae bacterium]|nr:TIGR02452 family protein [Oscillospiraceae bacterium]
MPRRDDLRERAAAHIKEMESRYGTEIDYSVKNSVIYGGSGKTPQRSDGSGTPEFTVLNIDSTEAVLKYPKAALLNFASYRHAGGGFVTGAWAQEEAICHDSTLYNVLSKFGSFYTENEHTLNRSLYTDRAIFSPKVIFERKGKSAECAVITCASPNLSAARSHGVTEKENEAAVKQRVDFVISIAEENGCDTVILGAWGCGVFGQDPKLMARAFRERLKTSPIKRAIFAIPGQNANYTGFKETFSS